MFRKTFICVAGVIAGVSAGAYSSGFFNEENVVTTMYNQALDQMGLETHDNDLISDGMIKDGMAGKSESGSLVSAGIASSGPDIDSQTVAGAFGGLSASPSASLIPNSADSGGKSLAQELLEANRPSRSPKIKRLDIEELAVGIELSLIHISEPTRPY